MANVVGGTVVWDLDVDKKKLSAGLASAREEVKKTADVVDKQFSAISQKITKSFKDAEKGSRMFAGAVGVAGTSLIALITKTTLTAARTETLGVAMNAVAKATGNSITELAKQEAIMKKQGIATQEARSILTLFMQSQLNVADASKIARVAQDLAVIAGQNSSETAKTLTRAISTQSAELLRQFGITKTSVQIFDEYAKTLGKSASELTNLEKKQSFQNIIMSEGTKAAGTYEAAMGTAGKKLGSLDRHFQEASTTIGTFFLPAFGDLIDTFTDFLKSVTPEAVEAVMQSFVDNGPIIAGIIIGGLTPAFIGLATATWAALAPLLPFIAAGALIGIAVKLIIDALGGWEEVQKKLTKAWEAFMDIFNKFIKPALDDLWKIIKEELVPQLKALWDMISPVLIPVMKFMAKVIGGILLIALRAIIEIFKVLIKFVASSIENFIKLVNFFKSIPSKIKSALSGLKNAITKPFTEAWKKVSEIANKIKESMNKINPFSRNSPSLVDNVTSGVGVIKDKFASLKSISLPKISEFIPSIQEQPSFATAGVSDFGNGGGGFNQNITINIEKVSSREDIDSLIRELGYRASISPTLAL